jgi:hypothetical protein
MKVVDNEISDFSKMLSMFRQNSRPKLEFDRLLQRGAWRNGSARSSYCCKAVRLRLRVRYASLFPLKMVLDANHATRVPWCSRIALFFFPFFFPGCLSPPKPSGIAVVVMARVRGEI